MAIKRSDYKQKKTDFQGTRRQSESNKSYLKHRLLIHLQQLTKQRGTKVFPPSKLKEKTETSRKQKGYTTLKDF